MSTRGKKPKEISEQETAPVKNTKVKNSKVKNTDKSTKNVKASKSGSKSAKKSKQDDKKMKGKKGDKKAKSRFFKLIDAKTGRSFGRYAGATPKQAASKGYTKILQKLKTEGKAIPKQATLIYLRESTQGSAHKIYGYEAFRQKLATPSSLEIEDDNGDIKTIIYNYRNKIKKVAVPEHVGGARKSKAKKLLKKAAKNGSKPETKKVAKNGSKTAKKLSNKKVSNKGSKKSNNKTAKASSSN